jgi:hypothetical protein
MTIDVDPEWWKTMFDESYLLSDARSVCDDEVTQREVNLSVNCFRSISPTGYLTSAGDMAGTAWN